MTLLLSKHQVEGGALRMVPPVISPATQSNGERLVFDVLSRVALPGWTAFHSLSISEHEYKWWGELDFVLLSSKCLLVLEVKGGRVACSDGIWTFTDRLGQEHHRTESPFRQAESGLMGLKSRLERELGQERLDTLAFGYGVVFPQTSFRIDSVEWAKDVVLDRAGMKSPELVARWLRRLLEHWRERTRTRDQAPDAVVNEVRDLLRPEFDRVPPLATRAAEAISMMERLTDEQYRQLDFVEDNPRLICLGGAGTGKTFLAAEIARRSVMRGERTLFTCWSPLLAAFIRARVPPQVHVRTFEEIAASSLANGEQAEYLIADEAQDFMTLTDLEALDRCIVGGLEHGRWSFFLDPNLQSAVRSRFEPDALDLLKAFSTIPGHLRWNCRNTEPIVLQTRLLTAADLGNPSAGAGPAVEFVFYEDRSECAGLLERHLAGLVSGDIALGEITILSPEPLSNSSASLLRPRWRQSLIEVTPEVASRLPLGGMTFARIEDFKGLENHFICVVDLETVDATEHELALLYVAMSRARIGLWMAFNRALEPVVRDTIARNLDAVLGTGAGTR